MGARPTPRPLEDRPRLLRFGTFEVDLDACQLRNRGARVKLQDQPFLVLQTLLEKPGALVTRDELQQRIWAANTYVEFDQGLYSAIKRLRDALGDSADQPRYIETLARRGYRFVSPVETVNPILAPVEPAAAERHFSLRRLPPLVAEVLAGFAGALLLLAILFVFDFRGWRERLFHPPSGSSHAALTSRTFITPPGGYVFAMTGDQAGSVALSPDGRNLAFVAGSPGDGNQLWVRPLDGLAAHAIAGTRNASFPFWSPDGLSLGFFADGKLKRVDLAGGTPTSLADAPTPRGASWSRRGIILYAPNYQGGIYKIPADGGDASPVTVLNAGRAETSHRFPHALPDGKRFVFLSASNRSPAGEQSALYLGSLDGPEVRFLGPADSNAEYASGYLLYMRGGTLFAQDFDPERGGLIGAPTPTVEQVAYDSSTWKGVFSVSQTGTLTYQLAGPAPETELVWLDRRGQSTGATGLQVNQFTLRVSPDGRYLGATVEQNATTDIWIYDLAHNSRQRFTWDAADHDDLVWSPDGKRVVFAAMRAGERFKIYERTLDGPPGSEHLLLETDEDVWPEDWSGDGRFLLFNRGKHEAKGAAAWVLPLNGGKPFALIEGPPLDEPRLSPDGKWVAFEACPTGRCEIYVVPFAGALRHVKPLPISLSGGGKPRWSRNGRDLFYLAPDQRMMRVGFSPAGHFRMPEALFELGFQLPRYASFDLTPRGDRFVINRVPQNSTPITVVANWFAGLQRAPAARGVR